MECVRSVRYAYRRQSIDEVLQQPTSVQPDQFWAIVFGLQRVYQMEESTVKQELTVEDVIEIGAELRRRAIASATPAERLAGLAPEERLAGLAPEEMEELLKQIKLLLAARAGRQADDKPRHRSQRKN